MRHRREEQLAHVPGLKGRSKKHKTGIHAGVVTHGMEGDGVDSLWRAMSVIEGGQGTSAEAKEM